MKAEIRATMDVEDLGGLEGEDAGEFEDYPIFCDKNAFGADHIILINRIKPHTDFSSDIESGIAKMTVIGLGKRQGAENIHRMGAYALANLMPRAARFMCKKLSILGGIAMIENELGRTCEIHALENQDIAQDKERNLLKKAKSLCPRLPYKEIDVLIIDEMGKNISGAGMDTHVIGRGNMPSVHEPDWGGPNIRIIAVLDVTSESHGNITAVGLADLTTRKLIEQADWEATLINYRTSGEGGMLRGRIPLIMPTGEDCVRSAITTCGRPDLSKVRFVRIRNTADTQYLEISEALLEETQSREDLKIVSEAHPLDLCNSVRVF